MEKWYSEENLKLAWRYVKYDIKDNFTFDVIDYEDIKKNIDVVISNLSSQLASNRYYPAPLLKIGVPKSEYLVRPGTVINIVDLIVLYALTQQFAFYIDQIFSDSVYAYRVNPKAGKSGEHLFKHKQDNLSSEEDKKEDSEEEIFLIFPYNWFENWIKFHEETKDASEKYKSVAVTDITAYFENISIPILSDLVKQKLPSDNKLNDVIDMLFRLLQYWDWNPTGNLPTGVGLPQGNDVSSFLSNLYLIQLDEAMLHLVDQDTNKYYRYVDDIRLYTNSRDEAVTGIVTLEKSLRELNLNIQSKKTKIKSSDDLIDPLQEEWMGKFSDENDNKLENALDFIEEFDFDDREEFGRPFRRCLTILKKNHDDAAVKIALDIFLSDPSSRNSDKTFNYLRTFTPTYNFSKELVTRIQSDKFIFPYHKAMLYRLGGYCRDEAEELKEMCLSDSTNTSVHWYSRMAALFCLSTFALEPDELGLIDDLSRVESDSQVLRACYVVMAQHSGKELRWVLEQVSLMNSPYQDYLRRYFFRLFHYKNFGMYMLRKIDNSTLNAPRFISNLHKLDLLKQNRNQDQRELFLKVISKKIENIPDERWPSLNNRLQGISDAFSIG